ncbi:hypothetical protein BJ508DRAFT_418187 [Ascobolus immersus RN42]|uniref:Pre-rRNA-processing protein PNO1 n=1 Tax=Ascobolus immersus RN42 TaxID=1160509 RepID=A0A3N4HU37_ASCIM|nr:hypothetical protein BJ508DRAFT_418187 [Ascobolus immersus RN42]
MVAPTALLSANPAEAAPAAAHPDTAMDTADDDVLIETSTVPTEAPSSLDKTMTIDTEGRPQFAPAPALSGPVKHESRKIPIPPHRMTPLKNSWPKLYPPLVEHLKLMVRMNIKDKAVELRSSRHTTSTGALQQGADFIKAFALGFDLDDAIALLRLDDLYIETFEVKDVKTLTGDHLARAIGRIAGKDGKMKFAVENATRTRVVLAGQKIHILGGFMNIKMARESIVSLILGSPPGKVYGNLRTIAARQKERF